MITTTIPVTLHKATHKSGVLLLVTTDRY